VVSGERKIKGSDDVQEDEVRKDFAIRMYDVTAYLKRSIINKTIVELMQSLVTAGANVPGCAHMKIVRKRRSSANFDDENVQTGVFVNINGVLICIHPHDWLSAVVKAKSYSVFVTCACCAGHKLNIITT
jgi:hypothetical protein